ncbi:DUF397 domain-containing protein [Actinocorallia longicatena]|uniref:DUF397 domain-containing protein n=1 Tax=Actinocorallia longicatena TaxID=111803 RepID=A0ABP6QJQ9_9ACTN
MSGLRFSGLPWRKSTYSSGAEGQCVEVVAWRKSSHSGSEGQECVEIAAWHKSSHSGSGGAECVEVAGGARRVLVRDSKHPGGGVLVFGAGAWEAFRAGVRP